MLSCREDEILPDCFVKVLFEMSLGLSRSQIRNKQEPVQRNYVLIHKDTALQLHFPSCKGDAYPLLAYYIVTGAWLASAPLWPALWT